jgi:hypothetical protein
VDSGAIVRSAAHAQKMSDYRAMALDVLLRHVPDEEEDEGEDDVKEKEDDDDDDDDTTDDGYSE